MKTLTTLTPFWVIAVLCFSIWTPQATAQDAFITTWQTDAGGFGGHTGPTMIRVPTHPDFGGDYNYHVDLDNDGVPDTMNIKGDFEYDFGEAGIYTIQITGEFPAIYFNLSGDRLKLIEVSQWGDGQWGTMAGAFNGCLDVLITAVDTPDISQVEDMTLAFCNAQQMDADFSGWDVSNVTEMLGTFCRARLFNGDLSSWDVSNVEDMTYMFQGALSFNGDISNWDLSSARRMTGMFTKAENFNGDISGWDISNVADMREMFLEAESFDQNLGGWDITEFHDVANMLTESGMSIESYEATLKGWRDNDLHGVSLGNCSGLKYCDGEDRAALIFDNGWTIFGDSGPVEYTLESLNPVRYGNDGVIQVEIKGGDGPFDLTLNGVPYDASSDIITISGVSAQAQKLEISDVNGCTEVHFFRPAVITTICDFSSQQVSTEVWIDTSYSMPRKAPETLTENKCITDAFSPSQINSLYVRTYLYEPGDEEVTFRFQTQMPQEVRAFIFTCEQYDEFSVDSCRMSTGSNTVEELQLGTEEPFYYIVVAGQKESTFEFLLDGDDDMSVCRAVSGTIGCGDFIMNDTVSQADNFNSVSIDDSPYSSCFDGNKTYTGGEKVYDLLLNSPTTIELELESDSDMGVFVFNYDCTRRCLSYTIAGDEPEPLDLASGYYFIVVDHNIEGGSANRNFNLSIECTPLEEELWPDRRKPVCPTEADSSHLLMFTEGSTMPLLDKFPRTDASKWLLYLLTPDLQSKVGEPIRMPFGEEFMVTAEADKIGDPERCGYVPEEEISYAIRIADRHETVYCTGSYMGTTDTIARFVRKGQSTVELFYQTRGTVVKHSEVGPPSLPDIQGRDTVIEFTVKANQEWELLIPEKEWITGHEILPGTGQTDNIGTSTVRLFVKQNEEDIRSVVIRVKFKDGSAGRIDISQHPCEDGSCSTTSVAAVQPGMEDIQVFPNPASSHWR